MVEVTCNYAFNPLYNYLYRGYRIYIFTSIYPGEYYRISRVNRPTGGYICFGGSEGTVKAEAEAYVDSIIEPTKRLRATITLQITSTPPIDIDYAYINLLINGSHLYGECWGNFVECIHEAVVAPTTLEFIHEFEPPEGTHDYTVEYYVRSSAGGVIGPITSDPISKDP